MKKSIVCLCLLLLVFGCKKDSIKPLVIPPVVVTEPDIDFKIEAKNNTGKVTSDVALTLDGTNLKGYTPTTATNHSFVLTFKLKDNASVVKVKDVIQVSGVTANDFSKPITYNITDSKGAS